MKKIDNNKLVVYASVGIMIANFLVHKGIVILDKVNPNVVCEFTIDTEKEQKKDGLVIHDDEEFVYDFEISNEDFKRVRKLK